MYHSNCPYLCPQKSNLANFQKSLVSKHYHFAQLLSLSGAPPLHKTLRLSWEEVQQSLACLFLRSLQHQMILSSPRFHFHLCNNGSIHERMTYALCKCCDSKLLLLGLSISFAFVRLIFQAVSLLSQYHKLFLQGLLSVSLQYPGGD